MEFLQYLDGPYAVIGLIVFVAAGALGAKASAGKKPGQTSHAPIFLGIATVALVATIFVAWMDMKKTQATAAGGASGTTINAEGGSNVVTDVESSGSGSVTINQGGENQ